jgi:branched-chain amino acid transport system permease protein
MDLFWQILVIGLALGSIYALIALGFVLIYKSSDVINFAQGEFVLLGTYVCLTLIASYQLPFWPALLITLVFSAVLGWAVERVVLRPFIGEPVISMIMATIGLSSVMAGVVHLFWGTDTRVFPPIFPEAPFRLGSIVVSQVYVWSLFAVLILLGLFTLFFKFSKLGFGNLHLRAGNRFAHGVKLDLAVAVNHGDPGRFGLAVNLLQIDPQTVEKFRHIRSQGCDRSV